MAKRVRTNTTQVAPDRNTLKVYWFLLTQPHARAGLRQIQRAMGFSSPNAALFHLNKLQEMQLVHQGSDGDYQTERKARFGEMNNFVQIHRHFIPRHVLYAITMTCLMCVFTVTVIPAISLQVVLALLPGTVATMILWYEAYVVWQRRPKFQPYERQTAQITEKR